MIPAACCCNTTPCESACAHVFKHGWTLSGELETTTDYYITNTLFPGPPRITSGSSYYRDKLDLAQSGTVFFTQGSRIDCPYVPNGSPVSVDGGCGVSFAGIPDLVSSGERVTESGFTETETYSSVCFTQEDRVVTTTMDDRGCWDLGNTGQGLPCMNNRWPWIIPRISGRIVPGNLLAFRADGSDPECHPANPGIRTGYSACEDAIGGFNFGGQNRFTIQPYEGMEDDKFYFRRWKAYRNKWGSQPWRWLDEKTGEYLTIFNKNNCTVRTQYTKTQSGGFQCDDDISIDTTVDTSPELLIANIFNDPPSDDKLIGGNPPPGYRDGHCGMKDHLLGIWSSKNGDPPSNPFGVNCVNSGADPSVWEGGFGRQMLATSGGSSPPETRRSFYAKIEELGCPCKYPVPLRCDGSFDPENECPNDPESPFSFPMIPPWEAWNVLGGNSTGPVDIDVEFPFYFEGQQSEFGVVIYSGTVRQTLQFTWDLNIYDVISSYDGVEIEAPCK